MKSHTVTRLVGVGIGVAAGLTFAVAGCSSSETDTDAESPNSDSDLTTTEVTLVNGWAKAGDGMTGIFGTLENPTDSDIELVGATTPAANLVELHETVPQDGNMVMREVDGGFTIPATDSFLLEPGGNHIMLMEMPSKLLAGEQTSVSLEFDDGSGTPFTVDVTIDVRDFAGANETYEDLGGHEHGDHGVHGDGHDDH